MLNELDIVRDVSARLGGAGIAYMLTGSMAMDYYALPRMTRDIDVVVALEPGDGARVVRLFSPDSRSELQMRDVRNLVATGCDHDYIQGWTQELGVADLWQEVAV